MTGHPQAAILTQHYNHIAYRSRFFFMDPFLPGHSHSFSYTAIRLARVHPRKVPDQLRVPLLHNGITTEPRLQSAYCSASSLSRD
ncbi:hypothetical protein PsYK624_142090 [Phanerochaete sordida]|uniref:Uncharacterized protein n=1 Tax=Phanerochaete sordida TaxID=48140 RepID=A0A9P3GM64_9APHY|nr:hypothetical protein PsYK624_142090 [Phanerochaete sordida]